MCDRCGPFNDPTHNMTEAEASDYQAYWEQQHEHKEQLSSFDEWLTEKVNWAGGSRWAWQQAQEEFRKRFFPDGSDGAARKDDIQDFKLEEGA